MMKKPPGRIRNVTIPPRPFLGGALAHDGDKIPEIVHAALEKISGKD